MNVQGEQRSMPTSVSDDEGPVRRPGSVLVNSVSTTRAVVSGCSSAVPVAVAALPACSLARGPARARVAAQTRAIYVVCVVVACVA